jgi:hypothetical protein
VRPGGLVVKKKQYGKVLKIVNSEIELSQLATIKAQPRGITLVIQAP